MHPMTHDFFFLIEIESLYIVLTSGIHLVDQTGPASQVLELQVSPLSLAVFFKTLNPNFKNKFSSQPDNTVPN